MKISELKQPYRRMAEYLVEAGNLIEKDGRFKNDFAFCSKMDLFLDKVEAMYEPEITPEIKKHFPADFDFSEEEQPLQLPNNPIIQNSIYTQLAREGKFDELPDTCEFSEAVELEVSGESGDLYMQKVYGKFKGKYVLKHHLSAIRYAQLPTQKIDFSEFKNGDVVEIETKSIGYVYGYIREIESDKLLLSLGYMSDFLRTVLKEKIKSITKIK